MTVEVPDPPAARVPRESAAPAFPHLVPCFVVFTLTFVILLSNGAVLQGDVSALLRGPDDFMRLVQVVDWLDGQVWTDTVQRRLNPPAGVAMHWSRLADIPLAAVIRLSEPWLGRDAAIHLAALLVPPALGGLFTALFLGAVLAVIPDRRAHLPILMIGTLVYPLRQFLPGRVDHHGLQLVLTTLAVCLLVRALEPGRSRAAAGLGVAGGTSLAIGLETLPFLGAATVVLCMAWAMRGGTAATSLAMFGAAMTGTVLVLIPLTLPRSDWATVVCDRMSLVHAAATAIVLAAGAGAIAVERLRPAASRSARMATVGGIGIAGLALTAAVFPQCAGNPYTDLPAEVRYWFDAVTEAQSLLDLYAGQRGAAISVVILPLVALVVLASQWMRSADRANPRWIALTVLVGSGVALVAWQLRGVSYAGLVASLALVPFAAAVNERAGRLKRTLPRMGLMLCVPMTCIAAVVAPQLLAQSASGRAAHAHASGCDIRSMLPALADPTGLGAEPRVVAAPIDVGPAVLLLTRHEVLAAPYHRNIRGLADNRRIFAGTEEQSLATIRARNVGAVLYCRELDWVTTRPNRPAFLNRRLGAGRPPWWLVPVAHDEDMGLYRVHPAALAAERPSGRLDRGRPS